MSSGPFGERIRERDAWSFAEPQENSGSEKYLESWETDSSSFIVEVCIIKPSH
jgi:hypothetical protein